MGVLERAGVVSSHKSGRTRTYQLSPSALQLAAAWLGEFRNHWERRLDQLDHLLVVSEAASIATTDTNSNPNTTTNSQGRP